MNANFIAGREELEKVDYLNLQIEDLIQNLPKYVDRQFIDKIENHLLITDEVLTKATSSLKTRIENLEYFTFTVNSANHNSVEALSKWLIGLRSPFSLILTPTIIFLVYLLSRKINQWIEALKKLEKELSEKQSRSKNRLDCLSGPEKELLSESLDCLDLKKKTKGRKRLSRRQSEKVHKRHQMAEPKAESPKVRIFTGNRTSRSIQLKACKMSLLDSELSRTDEATPRSADAYSSAIRLRSECKDRRKQNTRKGVDRSRKNTIGKSLQNARTSRVRSRLILIRV